VIFIKKNIFTIEIGFKSDYNEINRWNVSEVLQEFFSNTIETFQQKISHQVKRFYTRLIDLVNFINILTRSY
jgi:ABC-type long-subunit fatty acid transport system fused permease/ATPase subunit